MKVDGEIVQIGGSLCDLAGLKRPTDIRFRLRTKDGSHAEGLFVSDNETVLQFLPNQRVSVECVRRDVEGFGDVLVATSIEALPSATG